jgi:hypothetical protein
MDCFALVLATQDWHPADHGSFAANHPGRQPGEVIDLNGIMQILWPVHCVQGSPGAAFSTQIRAKRFHKIFLKGIDSYSGFSTTDKDAQPVWRNTAGAKRRLSVPSFPLLPSVQNLFACFCEPFPSTQALINLLHVDRERVIDQDFRIYPQIIGDDFPNPREMQIPSI